MDKFSKIRHLVPSYILKETDCKKNTNKLLRRNIRRLAKRKQITYKQAILLFYNVKSIYELDKNLLFSLHKNDIDLTRKF
jgi:hypothetical protein